MGNRYAKIRALKNQLRLEDDVFRDRMELITGVRSSKKLSDRKLREFESDLQRDVSGNKSRTSGPRVSQHMRRMVSKMRALWLSGWHLGVVRSRGDKALTAFAERMTRDQKNPNKPGVKSLAWLNAGQATDVIEALKDWLAREGGVDWKTGLNDPQCVLIALWTTAVQLDCRPVGHDTLVSWLGDLVGMEPDNFVNLSAKDCNQAIATLGDMIRRAKVEDE